MVLMLMGLQVDFILKVILTRFALSDLWVTCTTKMIRTTAFHHVMSNSQWFICIGFRQVALQGKLYLVLEFSISPNS